MLIKDVKEYFGSSHGLKKIGMAPSNFANWHKRGFIPAATQMRIEKLTKGALKADLRHCYNQNDKRFPSQLTDSEKCDLIVKQNNKCAICEKPEDAIDPRTKEPFGLSLDHCHHGGFVRGFLCRKCNQLLGCAKDDINVLQNAILYLQKYEG